jgi:alginate O-acetyltransferase complex protein AlgI
LVFSSLIFLFAYLPLVLGIYYLVPRRFRNAFLLFANLIFYAWGEPVYILLMAFCTAINFLCGYLIDKYRADARKAKLFLVLSIVASLGLLAVFKYTGFVASILKLLPGLGGIAVPIIPLPVGISFYTFQSMSYTIDVYRNDAKVQKSPISFATYVSLFPQLIAGPIVRYRDVQDQLDERRENIAQFAAGVRTFVVGLAKKVLLANAMGELWTVLSADGSAGWLAAWFGIIAYAMQIYFDFSAYSDMAIGLGRMFGFEFMENFNYPYIAKSVTDFWRRWHISLSTWFRDYLYIPLGGNRKGVARQIRNLLIVWLVTGLWHGANANFILWGLYYFVLLVLERFVLRRVLEKLPKFITMPITFILVLFGWVVFFFTDLTQMGAFFGRLFAFGGVAVTGESGYLVLAYLPLMVIAALAATPLGKRLYGSLRKSAWVGYAEWVVVLLAMLLCTAALVSQSYNPFLYYQF